MTRSRANLALFAASAILLGAAMLWSPLVLGPREARSRAAAEAALDRIAAREQAAPPGRQGYAAFGAGAGEREAVLPGLELGAAETDFAFDAMPDAAGLRLRAMSRPAAIAAGRVVPLLLARTLAGPAELGHEGSSADRSGPAPATR